VGSGGVGGGFRDLNSTQQNAVLGLLRQGKTPPEVEKIYDLPPGSLSGLGGMAETGGSTTGSSGGQPSLTEKLSFLRQAPDMPDATRRHLWGTVFPQSEQPATGQDGQSLLQAPPERGWGPRGPGQTDQLQGSYPEDYYRDLKAQGELGEKNELRDALNKRYEQTGDVAGTKEIAARFNVKWEPPEDPEDETPLDIEGARAILQRKLAQEMNAEIDPDVDDPIKPSDVPVPPLDVINLAEQLRSRAVIDKDKDLRKLFRESRKGKSPEYVEKHGQGNAGNDAAAKIVEQFPSMADFYKDNDIESGQFIDVEEGFIGQGPRDFGPGYGEAEKRLFGPQSPQPGLPQGPQQGMPGSPAGMPASGQGQFIDVPGGTPPITEGDQQTTPEQWLQGEYQQIEQQRQQAGQKQINWSRNDPRQKKYENAKEDVRRALDRSNTSDDNPFAKLQWSRRLAAAEQLLEQMKSNLPTERQPTFPERLQQMIAPMPGGGVVMEQRNGMAELWLPQARTPQIEAELAKVEGLKAQTAADSVRMQAQKNATAGDNQRRQLERAMIDKAEDRTSKEQIKKDELNYKQWEAEAKLQEEAARRAEEGERIAREGANRRRQELTDFGTGYSRSKHVSEALQIVMDAESFGVETLPPETQEIYQEAKDYIDRVQRYKPVVVNTPAEVEQLESGAFWIRPTDGAIVRKD